MRLFCKEDYMKRLIGFGLFWFAMGMILMLFLEAGLLVILIILLCLFLSYILFCH